MEEEIKRIATKIKFRIVQLKKDRIVFAGKDFPNDELDKLIDDNLKLQTEEKKLMAKVKNKYSKQKEDYNT